MTTDQKLSTLVSSQLPDFVRENNETFVAFLRAYYEYLEQDEKAQYVLQTARSYADVDRTLDSFVDYFLKQFAYGIPLSIFTTGETEAKRFLTKYIGSLYRSKGSVNALKFLFRLAFDEEINVIFPYDYVLKTSDGKYGRLTEVRANVDSSTNVDALIGKVVTGSLSGVTTFIDSYIKQTDGSYSIYLNEKDFYPNDIQLVSDEKLVLTDANVAANITVRNTLVSVDIIDGGLGYKTTDSVRFITPGIDPAMNFYTYTPPLLSGVDSWNSVRSTTAIASIEAPDGTLTATKHTEDGTASNTHYVYRALPSYTAGLTYTQSVYAKAGERPGIVMAFPAGAFTTQHRVIFNLSTGTATLDNGTPSYEITDVGGGWYRCSITATATTTTSVNTVLYYMWNGSATTYNGDGVSGVYLWRAQLETGTTVTGSANVVLTAPSASIAKVDETGKIVSVYISNHASNVASNIGVLIASPSDTRTASYVLAGNIATVVLNSNLKHGLSLGDNVNVVVSSGTMASNNYIVSDLLSKKTFRFNSIGANTSGNLTLTYKNKANLRANIGTIIKTGTGYGLSEDGQLDTVILLQDSYKWQQYSYIIRSNLNVDKWLDLVKKTLHPAGLALFGEVTIYTDVAGTSASAYAGPINKSAYDAYILMIQNIINDSSVSVRMNQAQNSYYVIESYLDSSYIDSGVSRYSAGATLGSLDEFKFQYGNTFPINNIIDYIIADFQDYPNRKSAFQPPSFRETPYRDNANANLILWMSTNDDTTYL